MFEGFQRAPLAPFVLPAVYDDVLSYEEWLSKVIQRCNELQEYIDDTIGDIDALVKRMIDAEVARLESEITSMQYSLRVLQGQVSDIDGKIDDTLAESKRYTDQKVTQAISSLGNIQAKIDLAKQQAISESKSYTNSKSEDDRNYTDQKVSDLRSWVTTQNASLNMDLLHTAAEINARIDSLVSEFPLVYDPSTGFKENVQTVVIKAFNALRYFAIRALDYDDQEMTAEEYDNLLTTAINYDTRMRELLFSELREMFSPFTGEKSSLRDVLTETIRQLQWNAKTASQFDGYEATADEFDASAFDAYQQDTNQYINVTTPDLKNKAYENYLLLAQNVDDNQHYPFGNYAKYVEFVFSDKCYRLPVSDIEIMITDDNNNNILVIIDTSDNSVMFDYDVTGNVFSLFAITPVKDVSELDK